VFDVGKREARSSCFGVIGKAAYSFLFEKDSVFSIRNIEIKQTWRKLYK